ncbi:hypothetical protein KSP39_PZI014910 [Platanthera zijinensis]|uniref:Erythronate-4-phosphate dehydrogenase family protein n=1 Tax=Platanthera zijinensis TaxID=2320716 RepID=A0AAP0G240_9ASPA
MRSSSPDSPAMHPPAEAPEKSNLTMPLYNLYSGANASSSRFEIRLFYVRISPCPSDFAPSRLVLSHLRREMGAALEINGCRIAASDKTSTPLRRDRIDSSVGDATYVSTDCVRLSGAVDFEVSDGDGNLILCGSLERIEAPWCNGTIGFDGDEGSSDNDPKTGWTMSCYSAVSISSSALVQPKFGASSPSIEVYVAGCSASFPLILTQTILLSPRKKATKSGALHPIPEDEETSEARDRPTEFSVCRKVFSSNTGEETDEHNGELKEDGNSYYPEGGWYSQLDGQLSWFNAGVRVGVGISLGLCLGIGIGTSLLMRSYQASSRNFKRRFF